MSIMNTTFYSGKYKNRPGNMFPQKEIQIPTLHVGILVFFSVIFHHLSGIILLSGIVSKSILGGLTL